MNKLQYYFKDDSFAKYYNLDGLTDVFLTCDVDWAPDFAIKRVIDIINQYGFNITFFATHDSPILKIPVNNIEVGLHPDFTRPHAHDWFDKKLRILKEIYPSAIGMRSHRNFFGQNIGDLAIREGLKYDASVFLFNEPFCQAHIDYNNLIRFSYMWEDGVHLDSNLGNDFSKVSLHTPGLKILNVHPILIYLNSSCESHRRSVTSMYSDLTIAREDDISVHVNKDFGITSLWISLLEYLSQKNVKTHLFRDAIIY